jgi:hypothetical protein
MVQGISDRTPQCQALLGVEVEVLMVLLVPATCVWTIPIWAGPVLGTLLNSAPPREGSMYARSSLFNRNGLPKVCFSIINSYLLACWGGRIDYLWFASD